uniref:Vta1/callose synthase N-terminal domain-containing protein n=1 Tax=Photinus pyralis TaxID=7054 RepID=A0A1Y1N6R7_PHOPY
MPDFPPIPPAAKHVAHYMKVADEHDDRNVVISYWSRMYACEVVMRSITGKKPPEVTAFLIAIMSWLEDVKKNHADVEGITNTTVAQALIEEYILQLFNYADGQDRAEKFGKNVVKAFYTAGILCDVLQQFGTLSDEMSNKRKYAKWKAAYIHNCLKSGEIPVPGPPADYDGEDGDPYMADDAGFHPSTDNTPRSRPENEPAPYVSPAPSPAPRTLPPVAPEPTPIPQTSTISPSASGSLNPEDMEKAQKFCKWAASALAYDDVNTAIDNLQKALALLQTGRDA